MKSKHFCSCWRLAITLLASFLVAVSAAAAEGSLSFPEALAQVWTHHPDILRAQAELEATGHEIGAAYTGFLPYAQLEMTEGDGTDERVLRLVLPLWRGGSNLASVDSATATKVAAAADLQRTRLDLGLRLAEAYFTALSAQEQGTLWRDYIEVLVDLQGLIERRAAAGLSPDADVQTVLTRLRQADAGAALNNATAAAALSRIEALLGEPTGPAGWPRDDSRMTSGDVEAAIARDPDSHPELAYAQAMVAREQAESRRIRGRLSPELSLRRIEPFGDEAPGEEPVTELALEYQTDSGLRAWQEWRAGAQRANGAEASAKAIRREIAASLAVARAEFEAAAAQLEYQQAAVQAADAVVASALRQFEAGRKSWIEVLNAQREAHENKLQQVQQRQRLWQAHAQLALQSMRWERLLRRDVPVAAGAEVTP